MLAVLGVAFTITTAFAGFAILLTGRYPRGLFDFNVGVMRWERRVGFSVSAALGTDPVPGADILVYPWAGAARNRDGSVAPAGYSILTLLVVIAGTFLLIPGVCPRPLFDFLLGVDRRLHRVVTSMALVCDEYPPSRVDMSATEPGHAESAAVEVDRGARRVVPTSGRTGSDG